MDIGKETRTYEFEPIEAPSTDPQETPAEIPMETPTEPVPVGQ